ncbi:MAG TPA: cobalamin-dependent protein [Dehalococcoidia bacterium]|nr:cobalamin-dependent protein [Dehalococcoidia bacterium]
MSENIIGLIKENVIQGRVNQDDEGIDETMAGQPGVTELIDKAVAEGVDIAEIINKGLTEAMEIVGKKFESKEYYIPDMLASAEAVGVAMQKLEPYLAGSGIKPKGRIIIATVKDDIHDIGKNIVSILLRGAGYIVKDMGNDVEPQAIVAAVRDEKPDFLGLSALLTSTMVSMQATVKAIEESGLRNSVKIIVGGAPVSDEFARSIGADGYGADGFHALAVVEALNPASEK